MNKTESCIYVGSLQDIPFKIGCAPPGAGWDDNQTFLFSFETDDEELEKVKELHA